MMSLKKWEFDLESEPYPGSEGNKAQSPCQRSSWLELGFISTNYYFSNSVVVEIRIEITTVAGSFEVFFYHACCGKPHFIHLQLKKERGNKC